MKDFTLFVYRAQRALSGLRSFAFLLGAFLLPNLTFAQSNTNMPNGSDIYTWALWILTLLAALVILAIAGAFLWNIAKAATEERKGMAVKGIITCVALSLVAVIGVPWLAGRAQTIMSSVNSGYSSSYSGQ